MRIEAINAALQVRDTYAGIVVSPTVYEEMLTRAERDVRLTTEGLSYRGVPLHVESNQSGYAIFTTPAILEGYLDSLTSSRPRWTALLIALGYDPKELGLE